MATSGSFVTNTISKSYFYVSWSQTSQSVANNTTSISWTAGIYTGTSSSHDNFFSNAVKIYDIYINGTKVYAGGTWSNIKTGGNHDLASGTIDVPHNSDGAKSVDMSISAWTYSSSNYSGSANFTLETIPRQATINNATDFNDESNPTITYTNSAGDSVTTLQACIALTESSAQSNPIVSWRDISKTGSSYTFNLTTAEREALRNAMSTQKTRNVWFFVKTILGGNTYYSYKIASFSIVNANPFIDTIDYADINSATTDLTNDDHVIIQGLSRLQFQMWDVEALKGATLTTLSININGNIVTTPFTGTSIVSTTYTYGEVDVSENTTAVLTLTDSRGNSSSYNVPLTIWEYSQPTAIITEYRESNFYTESHIKVDARYSSLNNLNTIDIKYRIKKSIESTWGAWVTINDNVEADFNADNQYAWDIQVSLEDALGTTNTYTINKALDVGIPIVFYDVLMRSVGVNCLPISNETLEVNSKNIGNVLIPFTLYENNNGSNADITLSDSVANYDYIEIFYKNNDDTYASVKVPNADGKNAMLLSLMPHATGYLKGTIVSIATTNITISSYYSQTTLPNNGAIVVNQSQNYHYITKVVGYK